MSTRTDTIVTAVKLADRISGYYLDSEILRLISVYEQDMARAGVPDTVIADTPNKMVENALSMG